MAWYVDNAHLKKAQHQDHWDNEYKPGTKVPYSGIYGCTGCGQERAMNEGDPFTTQNHRQHNASQGDIRWKLRLRAETE